MEKQEVISNRAIYYDVWTGTGADTESDWFKFSGQPLTVDIYCENADMYIKLWSRERGMLDWMWIPANFFLSINMDCIGFKVKNKTVGQNTTYQVVVWY